MATCSIPLQELQLESKKREIGGAVPVCARFVPELALFDFAAVHSSSTVF